MCFTSFGAVSASDPNSPVVHGPNENCTQLNTQMGNNVEVYLVTSADIYENTASLSFQQVIIPGNTTIEAIDSDSVPDVSSDFKLSGDDSFYEINTTAGYSGQIIVSLNYTGANYEDESALRLLHYDKNLNGGTWFDCTSYIDTVNKMIYGVVNSLSPFAILERADGTSFNNPNGPPTNPQGPVFTPGDSVTPIIPIIPNIPVIPSDPGNSNGNTQTNNPVTTVVLAAGVNTVQNHFIVANAAENTVKMQKTGIPIIGLILAILMVLGGLTGTKMR